MRDGFPGKVLLATDGSEDAAVAGRAAVDLTTRSGAELHVVHAFRFIPSREFASVALRMRSPFASKQEGRRLLEEQASLIEADGGTVAETHLRMEPPVDGILDTAEEIGAGLVVVGSRGLGGVGRLLMGSVSEGVVYHARCPVLVVREDAWPPARVLLADDGSESALGAARLAAAIGGLVGAEVLLTQVYPRVLQESLDGDPEEVRDAKAALVRAGGRMEERAAELEALAEGPVRVELVVDEGTSGIDGIAMTLLDLAQEGGGEPTLVAVGRRGRTAGRRRFGSVSTKVVRAHPGPVLVYPRPRVARGTVPPPAPQRARVGGPM